MKKIIAVVFDFDETLGPDSTSGFLNSIGVNVQDFWSKNVQKLLDREWDLVLPICMP